MKVTHFNVLLSLLRTLIKMQKLWITGNWLHQMTSNIWKLRSTQLNLWNRLECKEFDMAKINLVFQYKTLLGQKGDLFSKSFQKLFLMYLNWRTVFDKFVVILVEIDLVVFSSVPSTGRHFVKHLYELKGSQNEYFQQNSKLDFLRLGTTIVYLRK